MLAGSKSSVINMIVIALVSVICSIPVIASVKQKAEPLPLNELRAFTEAYYQIKSQYVKPVDDATLIRAAIQGMVGSLDVHSRYLSPKEYERFNTDNEGEYAGVGMSFTNHKFGIEVAEVVRNSPAFRAGIKSGMVVTHINQQAIKFMPAEKAFSLLKGEIGSIVGLTIAASQFPKPQYFELRREIILLESVFSEKLPNNTGYVAISQFTLNSLEEFVNAVTQMFPTARYENLIIDLRNNPGGVMEAALNLSDLFISEGRLLVSSGRTDDANEIFNASQYAPFKDLKVVVVINGRSASASEILAAALQDHHKALILGETSYGKGSIQSIIPLNHRSGIKLTSAEYFSPKGSKIQDLGVKPDVEFDKKEKKNPYNVSLLDDPQILQAYNLLSNK